MKVLLKRFPCVPKWGIGPKDSYSKLCSPFYCIEMTELRIETFYLLGHILGHEGRPYFLFLYIFLVLTKKPRHNTKNSIVV